MSQCLYCKCEIEDPIFGLPIHDVAKCAAQYLKDNLIEPTKKISDSRRIDYLEERVAWIEKLLKIDG